jgi:hypothetical protein
MPNRLDEANGSFWSDRWIWGLLAMAVIVIGLAVLAFLSPISQPNVAPTDTVSPEAGDPSPAGLTQTPEPAQFLPDADEIGHTDGIIFWSTVLLLILVIGTFRETFLRKKKR